MTHWLDVIGAGEGGLPPIPVAEIVLGPARLKSRVPNLIEWQSPTLDAMLAQIVALRGRPTVVLASGDPMWFGIGATLARHLHPSEFRVHPGPSSFQFAAARLRWPLQHVATISLHGRPVERLHPHVLPGNRILALTSDRTTLAAAAALLVARGYGSSLLTILENLGGPAERVSSVTAAELDAEAYGDLHVLAIDCVADAGAPILAPVPGLPDEVFQRMTQGAQDGQEGMVLKRIREYEQVSLYEAASHACISPGYLWRIEHGQRTARRRTLIKLCLTSLSLSVPQANDILAIADQGAL